MAELIPLPHRTPAPVEPVPVEPLWREALGDVLRRVRHERGERLADTARRAGVSPQYLSEVERGLKEPSSEMIAAIAGALDVTLLDLTIAIAAGLDGGDALTSVAPEASTAAHPRVLAAGPRVFALAS